MSSSAIHPVGPHGKKPGKLSSHYWGREGSTQFAQQLVSAVTAPPLVGCVVWSHVPVMFVFDNNDFQEKTPNGKGTTHCTNGIIIKKRVHPCMSPPAEVTIPSHRKNKRNFTYAPQPLRDYPFAPRVGPDRVPDATTLVTTLVPSSLNEACDQDQAWLLARLCPDLTLADTF